MDIYASFKKYIEDKKLLSDTDSVIIGLSGGADSVCLLLLFDKLSKERTDLKISAVHIHHGIRKASDDEEIFVKILCEEINIPCKVIRLDVDSYAKENSLGTEEAARNLRHEALLKEAKAQGERTKIALAHHLNDQAETVLFNLFRGSEIKGLSGIRPENGRIIRPLLFASKEEILDHLKSENAEYVTDESNSDVTYSRNRIRINILPEAEKAYASAGRHIAESAERIALADDFINKEADRIFNEIADKKAYSYKIEKEKFNALHPFMKQTIAYEMIVRAGGHKKDVTHTHVDALIDLAASKGGGTIDLPYNVKGYADQKDVGVKCGNAVDEKGSKPATYEVSFEMEERKNLGEIPVLEYTKWFDCDKIGKHPEVRKRLSGDYIFFEDKNGDLHKKNLKDYLIDEKISRFERDDIELLADGSHVLWVIGYRISAAAKVTDETKNVLIVKASKQEE